MRPLRAVRARSSSGWAGVTQRNGDGETYDGKRCIEATAKNGRRCRRLHRYGCNQRNLRNLRQVVM